jgi:ferrous iron transport protein A
MTLAELTPGGRAEVLAVAGCDDLSTRLLEMGLTPGVVVEYVGAAPLGDPLEFELRGYRLSLRRSEARRVEVRDEVHPSEPRPVEVPPKR